MQLNFMHMISMGPNLVRRVELKRWTSCQQAYWLSGTWSARVKYGYTCVRGPCSSAGDLYSDTCRLAGQLAQKLLFIKHNLKYV